MSAMPHAHAPCLCTDNEYSDDLNWCKHRCAEQHTKPLIIVNISDIYGHLSLTHSLHGIL
jgi:hypothetical protein